METNEKKWTYMMANTHPSASAASRTLSRTSGLIPQIPYGEIARLDLALTCEPLQKHPVHVVGGHPMKVVLHGPRVARRKEVYGVARGGGRQL